MEIQGWVTPRHIPKKIKLSVSRVALGRYPQKTLIVHLDLQTRQHNYWLCSSSRDDDVQLSRTVLSHLTARICKHCLKEYMS